VLPKSYFFENKLNIYEVGTSTVNMMGRHEPQKDLFSYHIDLDKRVRPDNPLRRIAEQIDFTFIRDEVAEFYGKKGNESVDPVIRVIMSGVSHHVWGHIMSGVSPS
jgi:hypothetical protein